MSSEGRTEEPSGGEARTSQASGAAGRRKVIHVTTVPQSLLFLRGQPGFMRERGFELSVVSSPGPELDAFAEEEGVEAQAVPMERRVTPLRDLVAVARLWRHFRAQRPDIVHAHTPKGGLLGTVAATLAGVPRRIYHMRGLPLMGATGPRRALLTATERVSCALATEVICVSHSLRSAALELRLSREAKIRVLCGGSGQGVDTEGRFDPSKLSRARRGEIRAAFGVPEDALVFGFVGRIVRDKGIHELTEAWQLVRQALPEARLLLIGPFEPQDPVDAQAREALESDPRVILAGPTSDTQLGYAAMDVVVLPTYREGFPNVPLEAAAMALPVVATRIPGCVDAVADGRTGQLVPARDARRLAAAMIRYGTDASLRAEHGAAGRERVCREFQRERIWAAIAERYQAGRPARASTAPADLLHVEAASG